MPKLLPDQNLVQQMGPGYQQQLREHALQVQRRQQDQLREKLSRLHQKNTRMQEVQDNFVKWVQRKQQDTQLKFQKVQKNREDQIAKIVKRCKTRDKYVTKKQQQCMKVKKKSLNVAWKQAEKFNQDLQNYYKSKNIINRTTKHSQRFYSPHHDDNNQNLTQIAQRHTDKPEIRANNSVYINSSKVYMPNNNNSFYNPHDQHKAERYSNNERFARVQSAGLDESCVRRNQQIIERLNQINKKIQQKKIQQLGEKMQKIQQTRIKRQKNLEKHTGQNIVKQRSIPEKRSPPLANKAKTKSKKQDRMYSEQSQKRDLKTKDRIIDAKLRREEMLQQHIAEGSQYLQNIKVRHLKTVIAKNISYNAMEKKLYIERLNN